MVDFGLEWRHQSDIPVYWVTRELGMEPDVIIATSAL